MNSHKILPQHLERKAYVYVRQSSQRQVEEHLESQDLQYQLVHRAQACGWPPDRVIVINDDIGKSAVTATDREGFQVLGAAVGLGQVGRSLSGRPRYRAEISVPPADAGSTRAW